MNIPIHHPYQADNSLSLIHIFPTQCKECEFLFACNGECPKNRFSQTAEGEPGLNYLCKGYYQFFKHVAPYMDFMKNELMNQRPPANIMEALKNGDLKIEY